MSFSIDYIIIQAGGKGSRLGYLTKNKPKALLPVKNLPMIFHLFRKFPDKHFIIIGDYKYDVLENYLKAFADVDWKIINAKGKTGTCAGIADALAFIPEDMSFMLTWCDLILPENYSLPEKENNYIGISRGFRCRWKYENNEFVEMPSENSGIAGHFIFKNKNAICDIPESGEFVRWLTSKNIKFNELPLEKTQEFGLLEEYKKLSTEKCRPFNKMTILGNRIIKEGIDEQGKKLAVREKAWYSKVADKNFKNIPKIHSLEPLTMEKIDGKNIYEYTDISFDQKKKILSQIINCLKSVQALESIPSVKDSFQDAYIGKTIERLKKVRNLVPFANEEYITINGRKCRNVFYHWDELAAIINSYYPKEFKLIHGDCTFSNMMLRNDNSPVLIDPRGYFGKTELFGDIAYDWAKIYYSIVGNYDQFNLKRFRLSINENDVELQIESNHWEDMEDYFFELLEKEVSAKQIKAIHAIIWLSLTTYAWQDYDSICGAFYNGLYYLEEVL